MTRSGAGAGEPPVSGARTQFAQTSENAPALALTQSHPASLEAQASLVGLRFEIAFSFLLNQYLEHIE